MSSIIIHESGCELFDEADDEFLKKLDRHLSFKIAGAEYMPAFRGYINSRGEEVTWDGRKHLMTSAGKFPSGLLTRVQDFYSKHDKELSIINKVPTIIPAKSIDIASSLKNINKIPYPYQEQAVRTAIEHSRGIVKVGTGGGKTLIISMLVAALGKSATIYVIGKDLLYQMHKLFSSLFDDEIGIVGDGNCIIRDINVATIQTVGQVFGIKKTAIDDEDVKEKKMDPEKFKAIKEMLRTTQVVIIDECQMAACDTIQEISREVRAEYMYGFSASPYRDDGADLLIEAVFGHTIVDYSAKWLIKNDFLVEPTIKFLVPPPLGKNIKNYQSVYSKYIVENDVRNEMAIKGMLAMVEQGFQPLVLFNSIKHGDVLYSMAKNKIPCALLSGKDTQKQRDKVKDDLECGRIKSIISSRIFDVGIDLPTLSGLVAAGAGKSSVRALQRIGRIIRLGQGKTMAVAFDFCDQAPYVLDHSKARYKVYKHEFDKVYWPEAA